MSAWKLTPLGRVLADLSRTGQTAVRCTPSSLSGCRGDAVHVPSCRYGTELRRVAAEQEHPRLWVGREYPGRWIWSLTAPNACHLDNGHAETWPEALAVGLAALEVASLHPAG